MFTASKWHFHFQDVFLSNQLLCFHIFFSNSWLMQHSSILWTTVCFCYKAMNYCLFKSSNILEHLVWPQKKLQCSQMLTGLLYVTLLTIYNIFYLNYSMHVSERMWVGERHKKNLEAFSSFSHCLSRLTDTSIWHKEAWLM